MTQPSDNQGSTSPPPPSSSDEWLAGFALGDLNGEEQQRLDQWIAQQEGLAADDDPRREFELVAAMIDQSFQHDPSELEPLPEALRNKIRESAMLHLGTSSPRAESDDSIAAASPAKAESSLPRVSPREWFAWLCVAASLLLALAMWSSQRESIARLDPPQQRAALLRTADDVVQVAWQAGPTPFENPVSGDIVWSTSRQQGYMRLVDVPRNDPAQLQYQLWIIDPERDEQPIDGGVFDVPHDGEVIVPMDPKLAVISPTAFAITIEQPGGVVVSSQERLPLLAVLD